jgi:hypothetical protein
MAPVRRLPPAKTVGSKTLTWMPLSASHAAAARPDGPAPYTGYDALYRSGRIVEVGCWAHARRRFVEALDTDVTAAPVLALIQQLYQVEHDAAELAPDARCALQQAGAVPLLAQMNAQRRALAAQVLSKLPVGEALRYLDRQRGALQRYVTDGRLLIDNSNA